MRRLAWACPALAVLVLVAGAGAGGGVPGRIVNGSFERSLAGWRGGGARLLRISGGAVGQDAARVVGRPGVATFSIYSLRPAVSSTVADTPSTASGWVRSVRPGAVVCLRVRERAGHPVVASGQSCVRATRRWTRFPSLVYTPQATGRRLDVDVYEWHARPGDSFDVDGVSLSADRGASGASLIAAGDIASCESDGDEQTAALLDRLPGTVATLGDNVYDSGSAKRFAQCYDPTWGRAKDRTRPSPGNHDYETPDAAGYFGYFGAAAGPAGRGFYSYDLGTWHVISLNSNCEAIGGCGPGTTEEKWLRDDLAAHPSRCTLAYWHHPRFSSGEHGTDPLTAGLFRDLYNAGAEVVLSGHDHDYERFAPQDPERGAAPVHGLQQFVVGTGGRSLRAFGLHNEPNSLVRDHSTYGVLQLTLRSGGYDWRFVPVAGGSLVDTGSAVCH
jgi:hypothetical protein